MIRGDRGGKASIPVGLVLILAVVLLLWGGGRDQGTATTTAVPGYLAGQAPSATSPTRARPDNSLGFVPSQLLVRFTKGTKDAVATASVQSIGGHILKSYGKNAELKLIELPDKLPVQRARWLLGQLIEIDITEPNYIYSIAGSPDDADYAAQWGLHNTGQTGGVPDIDINAAEAWDTTTGSRDVVIGIIDTGIDFLHEDLVANVWINPGEIEGNSIDDDGNGWVDDVYGISAIFAQNQPNPVDLNGHGTHVAGIIAAQGNNATGVSGVMWEATLISCQAFGGAGSGPLSSIIECMEYFSALKDAGINIVATNNSWGSNYYSQILADAIAAHEQRDMLFIAAAGNAGEDTDAVPNYPAAYPHGNILSVAAIDASGQLASFSNFGATSVDIAAPGVSIYSTVISGGYDYKDGTSMAAPFVTGAVGLMASKHPGLSATQLKQHILDTGKDAANLLNVVLSGKYLRAVIPIIDLDLDGMDDDWERANGLDATNPGDANTDPDGDGLTNLEEYVAGTNPGQPDTDGDGLSDADEINIYMSNPLLSDTDGDSLSDFDEVFTYGTSPLLMDTDGDGLNDDEELVTPGMDPLVSDVDADGIDDGWELRNGLDPQNFADANQDADGDGLSNVDEFQAGSDPHNVDTDGDGLSDALEVNSTGTDPVNPDTDADRMPDGWENTFALNPLDAGDAGLDIDNDNYSNYSEYRVGTDPNDPLSLPAVSIWSTDQGSAAHTGHVQIETDVADFSTRWTIEYDNYQLNPLLAVAADKIHTTSGVDYLQYSNSAFSLADGEPLWDVANQLATRAGPASLSNGWAYSMSVNVGRPSVLRAYDAETGEERYTREIDKQNISSIVTPHGNELFVAAREWIMSYDAATGDLIWETEFLEWDNHTPPATVGGQYVVDFSASIFSVLDRDTGAIVFQDRSSQCTSGYAILINDTTAAVHSGACITVYDLESQTMLWEKIVLAGIRGVTADEKSLYVADYLGVTAMSVMDGSELWRWRSEDWVDLDIISTLDHVFAATSTETVALNVDTGEKVWSYPFSGNLAISDEGALVIGITGHGIAAINIAGDRDGDTIPDWWEDFYGFDKLNAADAVSDSDADTLTNLREFQQKTLPRVADTDHDGLNDGFELSNSFSNPLVADTDHDGLTDGDEVNVHFTDPANIDTDADSYTDYDEAVTWGSNALDALDVPDLVQSIQESFEQGLAANWVVPADAAAGWVVSTEEASDGIYGLEAQEILCCNLVAIELVGDFNSGDLYFDVRKGDNYGSFYVLVYLDGILAYRINDLEWTTYRLHIPRGNHAVRFEFDGSNNDPANPIRTAWIDNVRFEVPRQFAGDQKNILVAEDDRLFEIDLDRNEVRAPRLFANVDNFSDLVVTPDHKIVLEDAPNLLFYDPVTGLDYRSYLRGWWGGGNNGLVATERHILMPDSGGLKGIRRLDLFGNTIDRLHVGIYFDDLAIGPDGFVYGSLGENFNGAESRVFKMHPDTLEVVKTIYLELGSTGLSMTVGSDERIYVSDVWCPGCVRPIIEYDNDGNVLSVVFPYDYMLDYRGTAIQDMDMHRYGFLIAGTFSEDVVFADMDRLRFDYMTPSDSALYNGFSRVATVRKAGPDSDNDGMPDWWERVHRLDPNLPADALLDSDTDGLGNLAEFEADTEPRAADTDGDGASDGDEVMTLLTDPVSSDTDEDGVSDGDEIGIYGTDPLAADSDGDGLSDGEEINVLGTNPLSVDSDGDGSEDGWEVANGLDPLTADDASLDADGDGLSNAEEYLLGSDATLPDTDYDGLSDFEEVRSAGTDPTIADTDADGTWDGWEVRFGLDPVNAADGSEDPDLDGFDNVTEFYAQTSPISATSFPVAKAWSTYRGNASHTGFVPRVLDPGSFTPYWSQDMTPLSRLGLQAAASADGTVWVVTSSNYASSPLTALGAMDGSVLWQHDFLSYRAISPPAFSNGAVFLQTSSPGEVWRFDGDTGVAAQPGSFLEQFHRYKAMTPFGDSVFAQSGTYGGLSSFDAETLAENWWMRLPQYQDFTPAVDDDYVYVHRPWASFGSGVDARLEVLHRSNGAVALVIEDPNFPVYSAYLDSAPILTPINSVVTSYNGRLSRFDLNRGELVWEAYSAYSGTPAYANGILYVVDDGELVAIDEPGGNVIWRWTPPSYIISEVIATLSHVIFSTRTHTYAVDKSTRAIDWSYPVGGNLTLGNDQILYITTRFGEIHAIATFGDADRDGMSDQWESVHGLDSANVADASLDNDGDGLSNKREFVLQTDPNEADSDADGVSDGDEVLTHRSNPLSDDTDGDGLSDGFEVMLYGSDPTSRDTDDDQLTDAEEVSDHATSPTTADTDSDGYLDGQEIRLGSDPNSIDSTPPRLGTMWESFESGMIPAFMDNGVLATKGWDVVEESGSNGAFALQASDTKFFETVALNWTANFDAGEVRYDVTIRSGRSADKVRLLIDGEEVASSGNIFWQTVTRPLAAGVHTLRWEFYHGEQSNDMRVVAMLDNIRIVKQGEDIDSDGDGMGDTWERDNGFDPDDPSDATQDPDSDGLDNVGEHDFGTDPFNADTDFDGMPDGWEADNGLDPNDAADRNSDADDDGLRAQREYDFGTDPNNADTDGDGMPDGWEVDNSLNPLVDDAGLDPDGDGVSNLNEYNRGTNPNLPPVSPPPPPSTPGGGGGATSPLFLLMAFFIIATTRSTGRLCRQNTPVPSRVRLTFLSASPYWCSDNHHQRREQ